jgi:uncharacterized protein (TIGR02588 family)
MVSTPQKQPQANKTGKGRKRAHDNATPQSASNSNSAEPSIWEWVTAAIGTVLLLLILGFLFHQAVYGDKSDAEIRVSPEKIVKQGNGYLVSIRVRNIGGKPAGSVLIEGRLATKKDESSQAEIDYIPAKSERSGGLFFKMEPSLRELEIKALGYQDP